MKYPLHRIIYTLMGLFFLTFLFLSNSNNAPNGYTGAPGESTCATCHNSGNSQGLDGDIQILGIPSSISPNTTYPISVIVSNPNAISLSAGFTMTAVDSNGNKAGTLSNASANASIATGFRDYFEHSPAQPYDANRLVTWTADWTAPAATGNEVITFYGVGNITDSNAWSDTGNDLIVTTTATGTINSAPTGSDLTVSNLVGWDATYAPGEVVFFDFDINNIGNEIASGDYNIMSYLSIDPFFDGSDISVGDLITGNTGVGTIPSVSGAISVPANLSPGNYYLIIVIDALSVITELDETNNILVSAVAANVQSSVPLVSSSSATNVSCFGGSDGTATAIITGGATPYLYAWQNGMTTQTISGLIAGTYPFTATDANGNTINDIAIVTQPTQLTGVVTTTPVQCPNDNDGSANISINGGTVPYNISWPSGSSMNLSVGNYTVTVTDNNGCQIMENYLIDGMDTTPPNVILDQTTTIALDANGEATIAAAILDNNSTDNCGGLLTFSASQLDFTCADLGNQNIDVQVTDENGNATTETIVAAVVDNLPPTINCPANIVAVDCDQVTNYSVPTVSDNCAQNIVPSLVAGLPSGSQFPVGTTTVIFEATDNSNNLVSCSFDVNVQGNTITNNITATNVSCFDALDGTASVVASGGTPPYQYLWSNMANTPDVNNLATDIYMVTISDSNGCQVINSVTVDAPAELLVSIDLVMDDMGVGNGSIFITASGGAGGYTYNWVDANNVVVSTVEDPQDFTAGIYSVIVTDVNGCSVNSLQVQLGTMVDVDEVSLENSLFIYPNPTTDFLTIQLSSIAAHNVSLQILDQNGKLVFNNHHLSSQNEQIDLSHLNNGLYWCKFIVDKNVVVKKFIMAK